MILSDKAATMLEEAYFNVLFAGIIPPDAVGLDTPVYLDKLFVYYEVRKRRIKSALGCPLYIDVAGIVKKCIVVKLTKFPNNHIFRFSEPGFNSEHEPNQHRVAACS